MEDIADYEQKVRDLIYSALHGACEVPHCKNVVLDDDCYCAEHEMEIEDAHYMNEHPRSAETYEEAAF